MTAEWLHLPPPYPPGVGPLCGAELEAWYEDLQDILGSDTGGAKHARAPPGPEKEPEFLDVLESCSLTWLTDGQVWGEGVQQVVEEEPQQLPSHGSSSGLSPPVGGGGGGGSGGGAGGDLLPPEFFELLSEGGVGLMEAGAVEVSSGYLPSQQPSSPSASEEEVPSAQDESSCSSSSASQSPTLHSSPPPSPHSPPPALPPRLGKRKRCTEKGSIVSSTSASRSPPSAKKSRREREQENERKVQELTDQNERLKAEIERLGEEVQRTRRALIERLVNTRK
ncbi:DNA damage-inducible transcript 3 protein [Arapaima gigas]